MTVPLIGCIADDFTGATDLAGLLRRSGMRVVQCFGMPEDDQWVAGYDAIVIALKTRSIASSEACKRSCDAAKWLQTIGVKRFYFKYCSTFDSTPNGNIGPVAEALMQLLNVRQVIFCPAFPENGRTVYQGHMFVGAKLLNECGMQHHPLNPMTDANLVRFLAAQSDRQVGLLGLDQLKSPSAIETSLRELPPLVITDSVNDVDLSMIAHSVVDQPLVTGGSAIAGHLAQVLAERGDFQSRHENEEAFVEGPAAVLSGSCSLATQEQVRLFAQCHPTLQLELHAEATEDQLLAQAKQWVDDHFDQGPVLISTTTDASSLERVRREIGRERAADLAEKLLSELAAHLVQRGVTRLIVAGGETSGSVTQRLGVQAIRIGPEITPGVPWTESLTEPRIALALKSGNFGSANFFQEALDLLP